MTDAEYGALITSSNLAEPKQSRQGELTSPLYCLSLARGFSRVFWGLLITLALFFGQATIEFFHSVRLPAYVIGSALTAWGLWILAAVGAFNQSWRRRAQAALALICLGIYFAPFLEWWKASPRETFYLINVIGLLLASVAALCLVNLLAADLFRRLAEYGNRLEALSFAWSVVLLMLLPLLLMLVLCLLSASKHHTSFEFEIWQTLLRLPYWAYMLWSLPCSLTLITAWKAKTLSSRRLISIARKPC